MAICGSEIHRSQNKFFIRSIASTLPSVYTILAVLCHYNRRCTLHEALPASVLSSWSRTVLKIWPASREQKQAGRDRRQMHGKHTFLAPLAFTWWAIWRLVKPARRVAAP